MQVRLHKVLMADVGMDFGLLSQPCTVATWPPILLNTIAGEEG